MSLKLQLTDDMKAAMRAHDKGRLGAIRLILAAVKQQEVDTRLEQSDSDIITILTKMVKQRRDSISQFTAANRMDLVAQEQAELEVIQTYLPQALTEAEVATLISQAIQETGAATAQDMGKVMNWLKPKVQGRTDMGKLSGLIKAQLSA
ncbi:GatB/YqeY domain-containing protein [Thiofilum flexile]|uniref:GatB/YqeY domain-containing protein n=1 Tax=Thiofilum flexile TaxID=125627 RepID=UPI00047573E8|nr:GatB/YqeY domain-containing protein [Thiofilum flexile]